MTAPRRILEIAVCSLDEAEQAVAAGADRLELSTALELGGLTPSFGLFRDVRARVSVPLYVLLRPRAGGFAYSPAEFMVMQTDAHMLLSEGADGIVCGALTPDGNIHRNHCKWLVEKAKGKAVFHRAFDFLPDRIAALHELMDIGFQRLLTSGGAISAEAGASVLASLVQRAEKRIEILPAGRIRAENVANLIRASGCSQIHAGPRIVVTEPTMTKSAQLAASMGQTTALDVDAVRRLRAQLNAFDNSLL